jgi:MFS family permease
MSRLTINGLSRPAVAPVHLSRPAPGIIAALFCGYFAVGLPLPVIPLFVRDKLGFSDLVVGLVIGIQFLATVLARGYAGRLTDDHGGKRSALQGAVFCALGGLVYLISAIPGLSPSMSLAMIVLGRLRLDSVIASWSPVASPGRSPRSDPSALACRCPGPGSRCSRRSLSARQSAWRSITATGFRRS